MPAWLVVVLVGAVAFAVRALGLTTANDVFIDELTYAELSTTIASGRLPELVGQPFFLHPPGGLLPDAVLVRLARLGGSPFLDVVLTLRWSHAVAGAVLVVLGFLVVRLVTSSPAVGLAAATVLALDPFLLRLDTRVMLETSMAMWVVAGLVVLLLAIRAEPGRRRWSAECMAGLLFGIAVFTKDMAAVPIGLLLLLAVAWRRTLSLSSAARVAAVIPLPYLVYLTIVAMNDLFPAWWDQKTFGLRRMLGSEQVTGFNMPGAPSLVSRLLVQLSRFGTSYVLIGLCVFAGAAAACSSRPERRTVGLLAIGAGSLGGYAGLAGTLEEQFGYIVVVASVLAVAVVVTELLERRVARGAVLAGVLVFLLAGTVLGVRERTAQDNGFQQVRAWMDTSLPAGARVGLTGVTAEFGLLPHEGWAIWPSLSSLSVNDADYVMTQSATLSQGYGYASPELLTWLEANAQPVFMFTGPSNGDTVVWRLDQAVLDDAVAGGLVLPPVSGGYP